MTPEEADRLNQSPGKPDYSGQFAAIQQEIRANQDRLNAPPSETVDYVSAGFRGMLEGLANNTKAGKILIDPWIDTRKEKDENLNKKFSNLLALQQIDNMPAENKSRMAELAYNTAKAQQNLKLLPLDETSKNLALAQQQLHFDSSVDAHIASNHKAAEVNQSAALSGQGLDDATIKDYNQSPIGQAGIIYDATIRMYLTAKDPVTRAAAVKSAANAGISIVNQNGKDYASGLGFKNAEINHQNFSSANDPIMQARVNEVKARVQFKNNQNSMTGSIHNQITLGLMDANPEEYKGQYAKAGKDTEDFIKTNGFTPIEYRTNKLTTALDQLKDGSLPPAKRQELLAQAQILGKEKGYIGFQASDGQMMAYDLDGKTPMTLDALNERLKQDDRIRTSVAGLYDTVNKQGIANRNINTKLSDLQQRAKGFDINGMTTDPEKQKAIVLAESKAFDMAKIAYAKTGDFAEAQRVYKNYLVDQADWIPGNVPDVFGNAPEEQKLAAADKQLAEERAKADALAKSMPKGARVQRTVQQPARPVFMPGTSLDPNANPLTPGIAGDAPDKTITSPYGRSIDKIPGLQEKSKSFADILAKRRDKSKQQDADAATAKKNTADFAKFFANRK